MVVDAEVKSKLDNHTGGSHSRMPNAHPLQPFRAKEVKGQSSLLHPPRI